MRFLLVWSLLASVKDEDARARSDLRDGGDLRRLRLLGFWAFEFLDSGVCGRETPPTVVAADGKC